MVHEKGIVYRDIKPENFVVGRHSMKKNNRIYIIGDTISFVITRIRRMYRLFLFCSIRFFNAITMCTLQLKRVLKSKISEIIISCGRLIYRGVRKRYVFILRIPKNINIRFVSESDIRYCTLCYLKRYFCNF